MDAWKKNLAVVATVVAVLASSNGRLVAQNEPKPIRIEILDTLIKNEHVPFVLFSPEDRQLQICWPHIDDTLTLFDPVHELAITRIKVVASVTTFSIPALNGSFTLVSDRAGLLAGFRTRVIAEGTPSAPAAPDDKSPTSDAKPNGSPPLTELPPSTVTSYVCKKAAPGCTLSVYWINTDPAKGPSGLQEYSLKPGAIFVVNTNQTFYSTCDCG